MAWLSPFVPQNECNEDDGNQLPPLLALVLGGNYKNGISYLNELCQKFNLPFPEFISRWDIDGHSYYVKINDINYPAGIVCGTVDDAKDFAALAALEIILGTGATNETIEIETHEEEVNEPPPKLPRQFLKELFSMVGKTVSNKFEEFDEMFGPTLKRAKGVAAIVLYDAVLDHYEVISAASGNQTISSDKILLDGSVVNDCHCEILARRSLLRFFYLHILQEYGTDKFLFEHDGCSKLTLKSRYSLHLFISTTPCGDGRIFSMKEMQDEKNQVSKKIHEPVFNDALNHGLLRCKIENGQGSIPVIEFCNEQAVTKGHRLLSMSCSDKILKWNVLGIQGSLLTTFMKPIYLSSITIGSLYHHGHLSRAVCCRLGDVDTVSLPQSYRVTHPLLGQSGNNKERDVSKSNSVCTNWNAVEESIMEIIQAQNGLTSSGLKSRLCRANFLHLYKLLQRYLFTEPIDDGVMYAEVKFGNTEYGTAKEVFIETLKSKSYGPWLSKPSKEKQGQDVENIHVQ